MTKQDHSYLSEQHVLRQGELADWTQAVDLIAFVSTAIASGLLGNTAFALLTQKLDIFRQRKGERQTAEAAKNTYAALREKDPYAPEIVLKTQVVRIFSAAGVPIDLDDLPESPPKLPAPQLSRDQQQWDFFLAYPGIDRPTASRIHAALAERGYRAFLDHVNVTPGERWTEALPDALWRSSIIVILSSENTDSAWFLEDEVVRAVQRARYDGASIIPVYLDGLPSNDTRILYGLACIQALDLKSLGSEDNLVDALIRAYSAHTA